jgi:hypothetical protein
MCLLSSYLRSQTLPVRRVTRSSVSFRASTVCALTVIACRDPQVSRKAAAPSAIETAIARDLTARFGTPVTTECMLAAARPVKCTSKLADGTEVPIAIDNASKTEWGWRVDGVVIETPTIAAFVTAGLAAVHAEQAVDCGPPIQVIKVGDRVVCKLGGGGTAFVEVARDGETALELALDPATAAARMELLSPDRDRELTDQSKALSGTGESDGEEAVPADAGVP